MRALGENNSVDERLGHCRRLRKRHALYLHAALDEECCRGSRSRQAQGFKPTYRRLHATLMPQFKHGQAQSGGRASSMPRGSLRPNLGLNRWAIATVRFDSKGENAAPGSIVYSWRDNTVEVVAQT